MGVDNSWASSSSSSTAPPPEAVAVAPLNLEREDHWRHFDSSVNAVSFGFVATAILISMFLVMAIFERFLRPRSSLPASAGAASGGGAEVRNMTMTSSTADLEAQFLFHGKLDFPSPKMTVYAEGVSVLMPGEDIPTFLAHPAPAPCRPEPILKPLHQHSPGVSFNILNSTS